MRSLQYVQKLEDVEMKHMKEYMYNFGWSISLEKMEKAIQNTWAQM